MANLDEHGKKELLAIARSTLESYLRDGAIPELHPANPALLEQAGAFVSLHEGEELRGCIGQIVPDRELYKIVQSCTLNAALDDPRFSPVTARQVPFLNIEISVLTPMVRVNSIEEIEVGRHGLYVTNGYRRGLLLPQVATHYGWSRDVFLAQTCRKAGLPENAWRDPATSLLFFEAQVFSEPSSN
jgi:AmmeMemoRadiSam system protein A